MFDFIDTSWEAIWFIALIFNLLSYLEKDDKKMFLLLATCSFFYWMHFYWLWLYTAAFINFFDITKNLLVIKYKRNLLIFFLYIISYIIIWWLTADWNIFSYLITSASILTIYWAFFLKWVNLRIFYLIATILYLIYSIIWHSIAWSVSGLFFSFELLISIYILYKRKWIWGKIKYYRYIIRKNIKRFLGYRYWNIKLLR